MTRFERMPLILAAVALMAAAPPSVAGLYESHQMEIGAALELKADGHCRYQLDYGAVSEAAEGNWAFDGQSVRLTSNPTPKAPRFELVRDDPAPKGEVSISVENSGWSWTGRIDAIATAVGVTGQGRVTAASDGRVDSGGKVLTSIEPLVPVYDTPAGRIPLDPARGHRLLLRFHANDLGKAAFVGEPLKLDGGDLLLQRYDTVIRFVR
jgi:hypothetical protein